MTYDRHRRVNTEIPTNFHLQLALGEIPNMVRVRISGRNPDVDSAAEEDIWNAGGTETYLTSAETLTLVSSSANDTAAGTGARTVTVEGLNASFAEVTETVTLNGLTPVTTTNSYIRFHKAFVTTVGSGGANAGDITIAPSVTTAATKGLIVAGLGRTRKTQYTVPVGHKALFMGALFGVGKSNTGTDRNVAFTVQARRVGGMFETYDGIELSTTSTGVIYVPVLAPTVFEEKTDIRVRCQAFTDNTIASTSYEMALITP